MLLPSVAPLVAHARACVHRWLRARAAVVAAAVALAMLALVLRARRRRARREALAPTGRSGAGPSTPPGRRPRDSCAAVQTDTILVLLVDDDNDDDNDANGRDDDDNSRGTGRDDDNGRKAAASVTRVAATAASLLQAADCPERVTLSALGGASGGDGVGALRAALARVAASAGGGPTLARRVVLVPRASTVRGAHAGMHQLARAAHDGHAFIATLTPGARALPGWDTTLVAAWRAAGGAGVPTAVVAPPTADGSGTAPEFPCIGGFSASGLPLVSSRAFAAPGSGSGSGGGGGGRGVHAVPATVWTASCSLAPAGFWLRVGAKRAASAAAPVQLHADATPRRAAEADVLVTASALSGGWSFVAPTVAAAACGVESAARGAAGTGDASAAAGVRDLLHTRYARELKRLGLWGECTPHAALGVHVHADADELDEKYGGADAYAAAVGALLQRTAFHGGGGGLHGGAPQTARTTLRP